MPWTWHNSNAAFTPDAEAPRIAAERRPRPFGAHVNWFCRSHRPRRAAKRRDRSRRAAIVSASVLFCARAASDRVNLGRKSRMKQRENPVNFQNKTFLNKIQRLTNAIIFFGAFHIYIYLNRDRERWKHTHTPILWVLRGRSTHGDCRALTEISLLMCETNVRTSI